MGRQPYRETSSRPTWDEVLAESARLIDEFIQQRQQWPIFKEQQS